MLRELPLHSEDEFKQVIAGLLTHLSEEKITWLAEINLTKTWRMLPVSKKSEMLLSYISHIYGMN